MIMVITYIYIYIYMIQFCRAPERGADEARDVLGAPLRGGAGYIFKHTNMYYKY